MPFQSKDLIFTLCLLLVAGAQNMTQLQPKVYFFLKAQASLAPLVPLLWSDCLLKLECTEIT